MTDTDRIVVWLRETMDAAQHDAEAATPGTWTADADEEEIRAAEGTVARMRDYVRVMSNAQVEADMALIVTHSSPAAVLRRIAAERKTLDDCDDVLHDFVFGAFRKLAEDTVRNLAEGYGWAEETKTGE